MNLWFASCGCWCVSLLQRYCRRGEQKTKEHFQLGLGEWVRLPSFSSPSASRSVSHLCVASFSTLTLWSSAPGMPSLFLENSSSSTHHPIRGSNRFTITTQMQCSFSSLENSEWKPQSKKKKNLQGTNITVAKDFRQEIFGRALLSTICFVWIGLTGGGQCPVTAGARPCQLMILDAMAWLPVSVSSYVQEGLWQPPWFRVHWRQHQQVWDDTRLAASASYTTSLSRHSQRWKDMRDKNKS